MIEGTHTEAKSPEPRAREQAKSERATAPQAPSTTVALQRIARDRALPPGGVSPATAMALQRAVGNRAVATLARQPAKRVLARSGSGKIIAGSFAASVGGKDQVIQVIPWTDLNGKNNNYLYID